MGKFWRMLKRAMKISVGRIEIYSKLILYPLSAIAIPASLLIMVFSAVFDASMLLAVIPVGGVLSFWMLLTLTESVFAVLSSLYSTLFEDEIDWRIEEHLELRDLQKHVS